MSHVTPQIINANIEGLVSVIVPTVNRPSLENSIQSVLNQDYKNIEIIVVGDGVMPDLTHLPNGNDVPIFTHEAPPTGRPGPLRNFGISQARGQFLAFLDDDDIWVGNKLTKQLRALDQNQTNLVCSNALLAKSSGGSIYYFQKVPRIGYLIASIVNPVILSSLLVKRNDTDRYLEPTFPEENQYRGFEDHIYVIQHLKHGRLTFLDDALVIYQNDGANRLSSQLFRERNKMISSTNLCTAKLLMHKPTISSSARALWHALVWACSKVYDLLPLNVSKRLERLVAGFVR